METKSYLSAEKTLELLGGHKNKIIKHYVNFYTLNNGEKLTIKSSKLYEEGYSYWFIVTPKTVKTYHDNNLTYICLVLGYEGLIKLPIKFFNKYIENADTSLLNDNNIKHYHLRIKYDKEILLYNNKEEFNITKFLLYDEEVIISDLQNKELSQIREEAKQFIDYEKQYDNSKKLSKHRKESKAQKERIAILEKHTCQVCGFKYKYRNSKNQKMWVIEVDHIIEKASGGGETIDNLWVLCPNCHSKKTRSVIVIDTKKKKVFENGKKINIRDNHLGWN